MKAATIIFSLLLSAPGLCAQAKEKLEEVVLKHKSGRTFQKFQKKNGKMHGTFEQYWDLKDEKTDILQIQGEYKDGKKTGTWTVWPMWNVPKMKREYEYVSDKREGKFTEYGDRGYLKWTGQFKADKESGEWTHFHENGDVYEKGAMIDGLREGEWLAEAGIAFSRGYGKYVKGKRQGLWRGYYDDRKTPAAEATFVDDVVEGVRVLYWEDGKTKKQQDTFVHGVLSGPFCEWYSNGQMKCEGSTSAKGPEGPLSEWYENGKLRARQTYKAGRLIGKAESWWEDGSKKSDIDYDKGSSIYWNKAGTKIEETTSADGLKTTYDDNGNKRFERKLRKGVSISETEFYENGQKKAEGPLHERDQSKRDGKWRFWYDTGEKEAEGEMCLYGRIGKWIEYHKNGKKKSEGQWFAAFDKLENKVIEIQILKWSWWDEEGKETRTENFPDPRKEKLPGK